MSPLLFDTDDPHVVEYVTVKAIRSTKEVVRQKTGRISNMASKKLSFEEYYDKYSQQAYGYIYKKIRDSYLAEDLTMEAFLSCYQKFADFDPEIASFQTWLYVIINNRLKNYYRDRKQTDNIDDYMDLVGSSEDDMLAAEELKDMRNVLADGLLSLPEKKRQIVILKYFKNKKANEIAQILGMTPVNVRVQLSRALDKLKQYFETRGSSWDGL